MTWILDNQLARRNVGKLTKLYLIGRRYLIEKKEEGNKTGLPRDKLVQNGQVRNGKSTRDKIADQLKVGNGTIARSAEFTSAVDVIVKNTGIKVNDILSGKAKVFSDTPVIL